MTDVRLPAAFEDLQDLAADWSLATEPARRAKRQATAMPEIKDFYQRMVERIEVMLGYLNEFDLATMPEDAQNLMNMTLSLAEVGPAVEFYKQPTVTHGFSADRFA